MQPLLAYRPMPASNGAPRSVQHERSNAAVFELQNTENQENLYRLQNTEDYTMGVYWVYDCSSNYSGAEPKLHFKPKMPS